MAFKDKSKLTLSDGGIKIYEKYFESKSNDIIQKYQDFFVEFRQWAYWYPDKFLDMFGDENFELDIDQRLTLRLLMRGQYSDFVQSRGTGKTFVVFLFMIIKAIIFPNYKVIFVAQTKEASARSLKNKYIEAMRMLPFLKYELVGGKVKNSSKEYFELNFLNGSQIVNGIAGEGQRGDRANDVIIDERMFVSTEVINDVIIPIVSEGRKSLKNGKSGIHEFNCIKGISSAGYYGSSAHQDYLKGYKLNAEKYDNFTLCTDYRVPMMFGRAFDKEQIKARKDTSTKMEFDMNYLSDFGGSADGTGLVPIQDIELCRVLDKPEFRADGKHDYIFAYDVARNWNTNKTDDSALIIGKLYRGANGDVGKVQIVNVMTISANIKFEKQALLIKQMDELFNPVVIVADSNVIGFGLTEFLMKETNGDDTIYPAYNTLNTPEKPDTENYITKLYALQSNRKETKQSDIIKKAIDVFSKRRVELLVAPNSSVVGAKDKGDFLTEELPLYETAGMIEESLNLDVKYNETTDTLTIKQRTRGINKDKIVALMYLLFYAFEIMKDDKDENVDTRKYLRLFD